MVATLSPMAPPESEPSDAAPPMLHVVRTGAPVHVPPLRESPPVRRSADISSLLNSVDDEEVVASSDPDPESDRKSDHDDDRAGAAAATTADVGHDAALLLSFTRGASPQPSEAPTVPSTQDETNDNMRASGESDAGQDVGSAQRAPADAPIAPAQSTADGSAVEGPTDAVAPDATPSAGGRAPAKRVRAPPRPKAKKPATAKRKPAPTADSSTGDTVVGETPPHDEHQQDDAAVVPTTVEPAAATTTRPPRAAREKRRPPPPPLVQPTPVKKPKTSARPQRAAAAAVTNYVDVTGSGDSDVSVEMVIANFKKTRPSARTATLSASEVVLPLHAAPAPARVTKRKHMSQRQYDELLAENRDAGSSAREVDLTAVTDVVLIAAPPPAPAITPSVPLPPCEFCRKSHSAHPTYVCSLCRRAYHDKCFVDSFKPEIHDDEPIEDQMERLSLHRPGGRSAMLRCTSCQAAFIDFCKNRGVHWDCTCLTCTTMPNKIADYRRVSLKRIIDEHNLEHAMKKEKKGAGNSKKGPVKSTDKTVAAKSGAKSVPPGVSAGSANSPGKKAPAESRTRGTRRARGEEVHSSDDVVDSTIQLEPPTPLVPTGERSKPEFKPKTKQTSASRSRHGRGNPIALSITDADESDENNAQRDTSVAMEVDQEGTGTANEPSQNVLTNGVNQKSAVPNSTESNPGDYSMVEPDESSDEKVTYEDLEERIAIKKEDEDTWSFKVACSSSRKTNESGMYKEATLFWHPKRRMALKCCCCDKPAESVQWFVQHTDPSLLSELEASDSGKDVYSYLFVLQRNGLMVPLQEVLAIIRKKPSDTVGQSQASQARQNGGRQSNGVATKKEPKNSRQEALAVLREVKFITKEVEDRVPGKRRGSATPAQYACEVVCAELGKWLKPLTANETVLRNLTADCGFAVDTARTGIFDLCESAKNPKTCKIHCSCCKEIFNAKDFVHHTRKPLLDQQQEDSKRFQEDDSRRQGYSVEQDDDYADDAWSNDKPDSAASTSPQESEAVGNNGNKIRAFVCVAGVPLRDPLTVLRLETFLGALEKLGNQADINKAIAAIVKSQESAVAVSL